MNPRLMNKVLGLALMFSLLTFLPVPSYAGCITTGGGSFKSGSAVSGSSVTICAQAVAVQPARTATVVTKVTPAPTKTVVKPAAPAKPMVVPPQPALKIVSDRSYTPPPPPKPTPKPTPTPPKPTATPKPTVTTISSSTVKGSSSVAAGAASFTPAGVSVFSSMAAANTGQSVEFQTNPVVQFQLATILDKPAEVRFTPTQVSWSFGDGVSGSGLSVAHSFSATGRYTVSTQVSYAIDYRFVGTTGWVHEPQSITVSASTVIDVQQPAVFATVPKPAAPAVSSITPTIAPTSQPTVAVKKRITYLVSRNCASTPKPVGCG
jgi:outer membrane biosynthesis protein TonB